MNKMVRIQKLKEPKANSGVEISPGETIQMQGLEIRNMSKHKYYASTWARKPWKRKQKGGTA